MKMAVFKAVCPLEIGDTVAIKGPAKQGEIKEAYYLPGGSVVMLPRGAAVHTVTDIAAMHFIKSGDVSFMYELDGSGRYETLKIKMPIAEYDKALKERDKR